jgi:hypothetical protein
LNFPHYLKQLVALGSPAAINLYRHNGSSLAPTPEDDIAFSVVSDAINDAG